MELKETSPDSFFLTRLNDAVPSIEAVPLGGESRIGMRCCRNTNAGTEDTCVAQSSELSAQALIIDGKKICGGTFNSMNGQSTAGSVTSN